MLLYICHQCGTWKVTMGFLEAIERGNNAEFIQRCKECNTPMQLVDETKKISVRTVAIDAMREARE